MRLLPRLAFIAFLVLNAKNVFSQQSLEAQRPAMGAYHQCIKANDKAYKLYSISQLLIEARQNRAYTEHILASDPKSMAKYKSYEKAIAEGMAMYRQTGGTAKTLDDITPLENPCPPPGSKLLSRTPGGQDSAVVKASSSIPNTPDTAPPIDNIGQNPAASMQFTVPKTMPKAHKKPAAHSVGSHHESKRTRKNNDARECAELESNQAIIACAEKFR